MFVKSPKANQPGLKATLNTDAYFLEPFKEMTKCLPILKYLRSGRFLGIYRDWSTYELDRVISSTVSFIITLELVIY